MSCALKPPNSAPSVSGPARSASDEPCYLCPGETHPISRSVHLARQAAFYQNCRNCEHRHDTGHLRPRVERHDRKTIPDDNATRLTSDGVRGVYLNEFARPDAERYAAAFAALIWEKFPFQAPAGLDAPPVAARHTVPTIVLGRDARASSPDIAIGVAAALQRMGCRVVDIGVVHAPCLWFAVPHLSAAGGVYVSGHGCGPAWSGLDFVDGAAVPWSIGGSLDRVESLARGPLSRPTRRGGSLGSFRAEVPYAAGMLKHLQSLRPLQIAIACDAPLIPTLLADLFANLPCRLHWPTLGSPSAPSRESTVVSRLGDAVREAQLHLGIHIAEDGQACSVLDERGRPIPPAALAASLIRRSAAAAETRIVVDETITNDQLARSLLPVARILSASGTRESISRAFFDSNASIALDRAGRFWFPDQHVACDAVLTLARLLRVLSDSHRPASALRER